MYIFLLQNYGQYARSARFYSEQSEFLSIKEVFSTLSIIFVSISWSAVALASSYQGAYLFAHELTTPARYFDGQNIAFETTPRTYPDPDYPNATPPNSI